MKKYSNVNIKRKSIFREKEYFVTLGIFFAMLTVILTVFLTVVYNTKLTATLRDVDNISNYLVASCTQNIEEINTVSKQAFISAEMMINQDEYLDENNNDALYNHIVKQFENHNSSLIVGMGYIPYSGDNYVCNDIVYSGTKTISFNYLTDSSKNLIDSVASKAISSQYDSGKMFLIYNDKWDLHIFARVVRDIRIEHFDRIGGIGFIVVNSAVFRQQKNFGNVIDGFTSFVIFNGEPILNEKLPSEKLKSNAYYVRRTGFSQYCEYYGIYQKSATFKKMLVDSLTMVITFIVVIILFTYLYKRNHDKYTRSFVYLIDKFQKISEQNLLSTIELTNDDENVNQVITTYNQMVTNVIEEREKNEHLRDEKQQIELQNLYQQINKHFIINVLSAAHSLIQLDKKEKAIECVENLADFLRYTLSINRTEASLEEEINSCLSYVNLQKLRFPNVDFKSFINQDITNIIVPKSIIQPLVENAYVHGIKNKNGIIELEVDCRNNELIIQVANTIEANEIVDIEKINNTISNDNYTENFSTTGHGIALKNIRKRLQLKFKNANVYLKIENQKTIATITIKL